MRVVVTGASGFLGGAVLQELAVAGIDCVGVSRRIVPGVHCVSGYSETPAADFLIHCAETSDRSVVNASAASLEEEANRTLEMLLARRYRCVIYTSSAVLYGDRWMTPRKVSDPVEVVDCYTRIKQASEQAVLNAGGAVARMANLYGPGMATSNVLSHILQQLGRGSAITMHSLSPVRDFLWVGDAARALRAIVQNKATGIFNVGSGRGTSIHELVFLAQKACGSSQDIVGLRSVERPSYLVLDTSATKQALDWTPQICLEDGVRNLVNLKMRSEIQ